jgi:hypothetical protein
MLRIRLVVCVSVLALVGLVTGCGGGGGDDEPLTKAEYVKQGNVICAEGLDELRATLKTYVKEFKADPSNEAAKRADLVESTVLPTFKTEVEGLSELRPPSADEDEITAMLERFEKGIEEGEEDPANFLGSTDNKIVKAVETAQAYGLTGCGSLY